MQKDCNEILMSLNIKEWCHTMGHETEDDIQDAYMIGLDFIKHHPNRYPSNAYGYISNFFKQKYKNNINYVSLEGWLSNNNEYKALPPTEIGDFWKVDEQLHYNEAMQRVLDAIKEKSFFIKDNYQVRYTTQEEYRYHLMYYYDKCNVIQYVIDHNIPLSRNLVCVLLYFSNLHTLEEIGKEFNISVSTAANIIAKGIRQFRHYVDKELLDESYRYTIKELFY